MEKLELKCEVTPNDRVEVFPCYGEAEDPENMALVLVRDGKESHDVIISPEKVKQLFDYCGRFLGLKPDIRIEVFQQDWMPGFAAFWNDGGVKEGTAHVALNLGSIMCMVEAGDMNAKQVPYFVAESIMHEVIHSLEAWAGVEFNEERVEALLEKYRSALLSEDAADYGLVAPETKAGGWRAWDKSEGFEEYGRYRVFVGNTWIEAEEVGNDEDPRGWGFYAELGDGLDHPSLVRIDDLAFIGCPVQAFDEVKPS